MISPAHKQSIRPDSVEQLKAEIIDLVGSLDSEVLEPSFAARLVEDFVEIGRMAAAGRDLAARQVARTGAWQAQGYKTPAQWMARKAGVSVPQAERVLETAKLLEELPATEQAVREGKLSEVQAGHIAQAAKASPSSEKELLEAANSVGVGELKDRCAKVRAAALPDEIARHQAVHKSRYLRHWTDQMGAFRLEAKMTPEAGAVVLAALEPHKSRIFREARKAGLRESYEACAADALLSIAGHSRQCTSPGNALGPGTMVHVRVDHSALVRGSLRPGETCEIAGIGPIPVATAQAMAGDAFLAAVLTDGADVKSVTHMGRNIPARFYTALEERDPTCVVPGCGNKYDLEIDHNQPVHKRGPTAMSNLARLCHRHHALKTYQGYQLSGKPGAWEWHPPSRN